MIDPAVERQYADCQELLGLWRTFHEFFSTAIKGDGITHEKEESFMELKSKIAMLHDSFMEALTRDQNIGQEVLNIVSRSITLKHLNRQSAADVKKMEIEWHESYLLLNDTIGFLEDKRNELAQVSHAQFRASKAAGLARQRFNNFFGSTYFKLAVVTGAVLFGTVGVQMLGIYDFNELGKQPALQTPYAMIKSIYRSTINKDSPWASIMAADAARKPFANWPAGVKEPRIGTEPKDDVIRSLSMISGLGDILKTATEYRKEDSKKDMEGNLYIHTFLLPDADSARKAEDAFSAWNEKQSGEAKGKWVLMRSVNAITMINGENGGLVNAIRVNVYDQK